MNHPGMLQKKILIVFSAAIVLIFGCLLASCDALPDELGQQLDAAAPVLTATSTQIPTAIPTNSPTANLTEIFEQQASTIPPTATATQTESPPTSPPTAFPTATFTATIEGEWSTATPTATPRWYQRRKTNTPYPTRTPTKTMTPTITLTPAPPDAELRIDNPGPLSKEVSPVLLDAYLSPGADNTVRVTLMGEDGRIITQNVITGVAGRHYRVQHKVEYTIPGAGELGRLILTVGDEYGRITSLSSVDIVLLQMGDDITNPAIHTLDPYVVWHPEPKEVVSGGVLWIDGLAYSINENPLIIELKDPSGKLVGSKQFYLPEIKDGHTHARFDVGIPYTVEEATDILVTLRQESDNRIPGTIFLSSVPIVLKP